MKKLSCIIIAFLSPIVLGLIGYGLWNHDNVGLSSIIIIVLGSVIVLIIEENN